MPWTRPDKYWKCSTSYTKHVTHKWAIHYMSGRTLGQFFFFPSHQHKLERFHDDGDWGWGMHSYGFHAMKTFNLFFLTHHLFQIKMQYVWYAIQAHCANIICTIRYVMFIVRIQCTTVGCSFISKFSKEPSLYRTTWENFN